MILEKNVYVCGYCCGFSVTFSTGAVYEVSHEWALGPELCDMWTSSDVLCCTASILHLVAIALDRLVFLLTENKLQWHLSLQIYLYSSSPHGDKI